MPIGTINLKYTTKNFPIKKSFDTRINVKDSIEQLRFSTVFSEDAVGVAFINSPEINASKNILIKDTSEDIPNNSRLTEREITYLADSFIIDFASFYITDISKEINGESTPLYLWHDLSSASDITNLEVLDASMTPVKEDEWMFFDESTVLGETRKGIYTNLKCSLDQRENIYEVYYVRYLNKDNNIIVKDLLDSKPFYTQASFFTDRKKRQYIISTLSSGYQVDVIFDSLNYSPTGVTGEQRFFIKAREKGKLYIEKPAATMISQRWNLRVSPGDFYLNGRRYWVPEYYTQPYSPALPYKLEKEREIRVLDNTILFTDLFPIANLKIDGYFLYISIKDSKGTLVRAITNDPDADTLITKNGFVTDIFYEKDIIESVSDSSGFIKLKEPLAPGSKAFITYRYIENFFTYTDLSVNPSISQDILGKRIIMYVLPEEDARSIHHLIVDDKGVVLEASETDMYKSFSGQATAPGSVSAMIDENLPEADYLSGFELEILSGENSGVKVKIFSYDPMGKTITLQSSLSYPIEKGTHYRILKKVKDYSTFDETLDETFTYNGWEGFSEMLHYLKLADVYVIQNLNITDIESFDARVRGGGIRDERVDSAVQLQDEARWYWDIGNFDGTPFPGMGAILIELPRYILKEMGGPFERPQVEEVVYRHLASGSYPVIKYYDISTEIIKIIPGDKKVDIEWNEIDASEYNIYIGNSPDNVFLHASQPGTRAYISIEELENNKIYYVQIEPIVAGQARLRSRTIGFMPFNFSTTLPPIKYNEGKYLGGVYE